MNELIKRLDFDKKGKNPCTFNFNYSTIINETTISIRYFQQEEIEKPFEWNIF